VVRGLGTNTQTPEARNQRTTAAAAVHPPVVPNSCYRVAPAARMQRHTLKSAHPAKHSSQHGRVGGCEVVVRAGGLRLLTGSVRRGSKGTHSQLHTIHRENLGQHTPTGHHPLESQPQTSGKAYGVCSLTTTSQERSHTGQVSQRTAATGMRTGTTPSPGKGATAAADASTHSAILNSKPPTDTSQLQQLRCTRTGRCMGQACLQPPSCSTRKHPTLGVFLVQSMGLQAWLTSLEDRHVLPAQHNVLLYHPPTTLLNP
jgi:hypothetical protein